jgi:hypothetical protein
MNESLPPSRKAAKFRKEDVRSANIARVEAQAFEMET